MATPPVITLQDAANVMMAMASPDPRLAKYGGGFIGNIDFFKKPLLDATKPLSVFQVRNPNPTPPYRFGDSTKPFPSDGKYYNIVLLGPLVKDGPFFSESGVATILGQPMGSLSLSEGFTGLHAKAVEDIRVKLGPLGKITIPKMVAEADIDKTTQSISLKGYFGSQAVQVILDDAMLTIDVPASCVNPFEIKAKVGIQASTNIADVFEAQGGANVDPSKIQAASARTCRRRSARSPTNTSP